MAQPRLIFVYNADSGVMNTLLDIGHKLLSPSTYDCKLCALTHSTFRMRPEWHAFIDRLGYPVEFLHRDEFQARYGNVQIPAPAVLLASGESLIPWIRPEEINECGTLMELEAKISERLAQLGHGD